MGGNGGGVELAAEAKAGAIETAKVIVKAVSLWRQELTTVGESLGDGDSLCRFGDLSEGNDVLDAVEWRWKLQQRRQ